MRIPSIPPPLQPEVITAFGEFKSSSNDLTEKLGIADPEEKHLHWDEFRFKFPGETKEAVVRRWHETRAGRILRRTQTSLRQSNGAFFTFVELNRFRISLHRVDSRAGTVVTRPLPDLNESTAIRYFQRTLIEEPFSSSVLEGAATTRAIARKLIDENRTPRTLDERMVLNNFRAMEFVRKNKVADLTPELILELQKIVTEGTLDNPAHSGAFRTEDDFVRVEDATTGDVLHIPPAASDVVTRVKQLCEFANVPIESTPFIHPILRAIIVHFMLAYDHPFVDGNGRTARALFYWLALKAGYWLFEYISISAVIRNAPKKYGQAFLFVETDDGDLTYFIDHQLDTIEKAIAELHKYLDRKESEANTLAAAMKSGLNQRQIQIIQDALKRPNGRYTIAEHQKLTGVSYLTARSDFEELARQGYFLKKREGKSSIFRPSSNLEEKVSPAKQKRQG